MNLAVETVECLSMVVAVPSTSALSRPWSLLSDPASIGMSAIPTQEREPTVPGCQRDGELKYADTQS